MKKTIIIFNLLLTLPIFVLHAQTENNSEVLEIQCYYDYSVRLKQISESEYTIRKNESEHLRQKPYKVIKDHVKIRRILRNRFRLKSIGVDEIFHIPMYKIILKNGTKMRFYTNKFLAYYPKFKVLICETRHSLDGENVFCLKDIHYYGNPKYHIVSPDKQFRINGAFDGLDCVIRSIDKWNESKKMYEFVGYLSLEGANNRYDANNEYDTCWFFDCLWTDNNKAIFSNQSGYHELEIIETKKTF